MLTAKQGQGAQDHPVHITWLIDCPRESAASSPRDKLFRCGARARRRALPWTATASREQNSAGNRIGIDRDGPSEGLFLALPGPERSAPVPRHPGGQIVVRAVPRVKSEL